LDELAIVHSKQYKPKNTKKDTQGVTVKGIDNILVRFSKCCSPVPGDDIIGFITRGRGVSVHRKDCLNVTNETDHVDRFIEVEWDEERQTAYQSEIQIIAADRKGLLSEITNVLSETKLTVTAVNARTSREKIAIINLTVEITNVNQLDKLINKIRTMQGVMDVFRVTS
jgi:GTP pyrophosphokinase